MTGRVHAEPTLFTMPAMSSFFSKKSPTSGRHVASFVRSCGRVPRGTAEDSSVLGHPAGGIKKAPSVPGVANEWTPVIVQQRVAEGVA